MKTFQELIKELIKDNKHLTFLKELTFEDLPNLGYHYSIFPAFLEIEAPTTIFEETLSKFDSEN